MRRRSMNRGTGENGKRKLYVLRQELERAGAYGDGPPAADRKSRLFIVAGILLGVAVGLLAILVVGMVEILVL